MTSDLANHEYIMRLPWKPKRTAFWSFFKELPGLWNQNASRYQRVGPQTPGDQKLLCLGPCCISSSGCRMGIYEVLRDEEEEKTSWNPGPWAQCFACNDNLETWRHISIQRLHQWAPGGNTYGSTWKGTVLFMSRPWPGQQHVPFVPKVLITHSHHSRKDATDFSFIFP